MKYEGSAGSKEERLTTEDLARTSDTQEEPRRQDREGTEAAGGRPTFPGEATGGLAGADAGTAMGEGGPVEEEPERRETLEERETAQDQETPEERGNQQGREPAERTEGEPGIGEEPLFAPEDEHELRSRWLEIQNQFVDDPREAVSSADALVADLMQRLATSFADHKRGLEQQWNRRSEVQTEDLRLALQQYRSFFQRILTS
ncbi:hypothetical protein [Kitasatospora sp. HPMI-4]|uniref:hypothetical protein n=1 Tax=Kitasatospora sp. HPMI-4 TaxID=3448443 RepID=UPI003F1AE4E5